MFKFYELDQKIQENNNFKLAAKYIIENNVDLNEFLDNILIVLSEEDEQKPGFFQRIKQNVSNMWNKFRGNPYDVESVTNALLKVSQFLNGNEQLKNTYNDEINALANVVKNIQAKSTLVPTTEVKPTPEAEEAKPKNEDLMQSYMKRLTYGKPVDILVGSAHENSAKLYAAALAKQDPREIEETKDRLMDSLKQKVSIMEKRHGKDVLSQSAIKQVFDHETWALWDIGKQLYMMENPSKSGAGYTLGNPIVDKNIQEDITDRMIGWAVTGGGTIDLNNPTGPRLPKPMSSLKLAEIGKKVLDQATLDTMGK